MDAIVTNNVGCFRGRYVQRYLARFNIHHLKAVLAHPQANGWVKQTSPTLKNAGSHVYLHDASSGRDHDKYYG